MNAVARPGALCVLDATDVARTLDRIAHQIIEASAKAYVDGLNKLASRNRATQQPQSALP